MSSFQHRFSRFCGQLSVAVVALGALGACTSTPHAASATSPANGGEGQRKAVPAAQPYDIVLGDKIGVIEYAQLRLQFACLADAGYPQNLKAMRDGPTNPFEGLTVSARSFGPTSEEEARRVGFGNDTEGEPARVVSFDPNYDANLERCGKQADDQIGAETKRVVESYYDLVRKLAVYRRDVDEELPADLPQKSLDCLTKSGYNVPDREQFLRTPNPRLLGIPFGQQDSGTEETWNPPARQGTVQVGPAVPPRHYKPTQQESNLAVAWYRCGVQTGRVEQQLATVQKVQRRYVERYQTEFDELNPQVERLAKRAAELVKK